MQPRWALETDFRNAKNIGALFISILTVLFHFTVSYLVCYILIFVVIDIFISNFINKTSSQKDSSQNVLFTTNFQLCYPQFDFDLKGRQAYFTPVKIDWLWAESWVKSGVAYKSNSD